MPNSLYTISPDHPFTETLARYVLQHYGDNPLKLARLLIILPSRRSCLSLRNAFLRITGGKPLLLPQMQPMNSLSENLLIPQGEIITHPATDAVFTQKRLFLLAHLIQAYNGSRLDHALRLANELAELIDEVEREHADLGQLASIIPDDFAEYWQKTLGFMQIMTQALPAILNEQQLVNPVTVQEELLQALATTWRNSPPDFPILVAGVTNSTPAMLNLMEVIASLPENRIILPAFNSTLDEVVENHPQYSMLKMVRHLKQEVQPLEAIQASPRSQLFYNVTHTENLAVDFDINAALAGISYSECANIQEEASVAALILRATLETEGKTAALVTQDRNLARRVVAIMQRFGIAVDDSAGIPLLHTPLGIFLQLVAESVCNNEDRVKHITLLKNPFVKGGMERTAFLHQVREYELALRDQQEAVPISIAEILTVLEHFREVISKPDCTIKAIIKAHLECCESLAGGNLWQGQESKQIGEFFALLLGSDFDTIPLKTTDSLLEIYPDLFKILLEKQVFRSVYATHPRLSILGLAEARLQRFDCVIMAGLNEGTLPAPIEPDAWLNRAMRKAVGLPGYEAGIGETALDFFLLSHTPELHLTRSVKVEGTPTTPSRWLMKLTILLESSQLTITDHYWIRLARMLDFGKGDAKITRPRPAPPLTARPQLLHVSKVEMLLRNPYQFYATEILRLSPLNPLMQEPEAADFGNAVHTALEQFCLDFPETLPDNALEKLLAIGENCLQPIAKTRLRHTIWSIRFAKIARWVIEQETARREEIASVLPEISGTLKLGDFTLKGRADRIEIGKDGKLTIIDYKTGKVPTLKDVASGVAGQLLLLALIMQSHMAKPVASLAYWGVYGNKKAGEISTLSEDIATQCELARAGVISLFETYTNPDFPYLAAPIPDRLSRYDDYAHLARMKEWGI